MKNKIFKSLLTISIIAALLVPVKVNAIEETVTSNEALASSELNNYFDEKSVNELNFLRTNSVSSTKSEYYVKFVSKEDGTVVMDPTHYTEEEFIEEQISTYTFPKNQVGENSWMRLTFEADKLRSGRYSYYIFYEWKTRPIFTGNDVISLGYTSNISCDRSTARSHHEHLYYSSNADYPYYSSTDYTYKNTSNFKSELNGIAFKFKLPATPDPYPGIYRGYLTVQGGFTSSSYKSATMEMAYTHQQLALNYSIDAIKFLQGGSVSVGIIGSEDTFRVADEFVRF